jgi:hypothetical protein
MMGVGPAITAGWLLESSLTPGVYLRGGPGLEMLWNTYETTLAYLYPLQDMQNTSKQRVLALPLDAFVGFEVAHTLALELGGTVGLAYSTLRSDICGDRIDVRAYYGLEGGLALRLGDRGQYLASAHAVASSLPVVTCVNSGINPDTGTMPAPLWDVYKGFNALGGVLRIGALF